MQKHSQVRKHFTKNSLQVAVTQGYNYGSFTCPLLPSRTRKAYQLSFSHERTLLRKGTKDFVTRSFIHYFHAVLVSVLLFEGKLDI